MPLERISRTAFHLIHGKNLVYNQCWEDPRLDRIALDLTPQDEVLVITSAGCNALDYALAGVKHVFAVDLNFRQNALLELKKAAARSLDYEDLFQLFGRGWHPRWDSLYEQVLAPQLPTTARRYWDRKGAFFRGRGRRRSFYFRGSSGLFAWMVNAYINRVARIRDAVDALLNAGSVEEQKEIYDRSRLRESLFRPMVQWLLRRDTTMAMLGVPRSQRRQLDHMYPGGIVQFIVDRIETVFTRLPLADNYFWRVYLTGEYTPDCCPEYLKRENYDRLRETAADCVTTHTQSVLAFLEAHPGEVSKFVLLDHMDWLYSHYRDVLQAEWQAIISKSAPEARVIWRSAGLQVDFVDPLIVRADDRLVRVGEVLSYQTERAEELHRLDRVNTYGSFHIADLKRPTEAVAAAGAGEAVRY